MTVQWAIRKLYSHKLDFENNVLMGMVLALILAQIAVDKPEISIANLNDQRKPTALTII